MTMQKVAAMFDLDEIKQRSEKREPRSHALRGNA